MVPGHDVVTTKFRMGIGLTLLAAVTGAAQLPPKVQLDRLLLRADLGIEEERYEEAVAALEEAGRLARAEGLELPDRIWFRRASLALALERPADAVKFVTRYLQGAGRDSDHYQDALALIEKAEAEVARREVVERVRPSPESCARRSRTRRSAGSRLSGTAGCGTGTRRTSLQWKARASAWTRSRTGSGSGRGRTSTSRIPARESSWRVSRPGVGW